MSKIPFPSRHNSVHVGFSTPFFKKFSSAARRFDRDRKLGLLQILLIYQGCHFCGSEHGGQSIESAIQDVGVILGSHFGWGANDIVSRQAFHRAIKKITDDDFKSFSAILASLHTPSAKVTALSQRHGIRFLHSDGTQIFTQRSVELVESFGLQQNGKNETSHYPQLNWVLMTEAGTNHMIAHDIMRCKDTAGYHGDLPTSERASLRTMHGHIGEKDCIIADSGFSSYEHFFDLIESNKKFMIGIPKSWLPAKRFKARRKADAIIEFTIPKKRKYTGKTLRLRIFTIRDEKNNAKYIATNLFDTFTLNDCRLVYKTRWAIEELFRRMKELLSARQLRSKTVQGVRLELWAILLFLQASCSLQSEIQYAVNKPHDLFSTLKCGYKKTKNTATHKAAWCAIACFIAPNDRERIDEFRKRFGYTINTMQPYVPDRKFRRLSRAPHGVFEPQRPSRKQREYRKKQDELKKCV